MAWNERKKTVYALEEKKDQRKKDPFCLIQGYSWRFSVKYKCKNDKHALFTSHKQPPGVTEYRQ